MNPRGSNPSGGQQYGPGSETGSAHHVRETASDAAGQVADRVGEAWDSTKRGVREGWDTVSDYASSSWDEVSTFMRRHPFTSCAVAFGLGMLAMSMFPSHTHDVARRMERSSY